MCRPLLHLQATSICFSLAAGSGAGQLQQGAGQDLQYSVQEQQHAAHGFLFILSASQQR